MRVPESISKKSKKKVVLDMLAQGKSIRSIRQYLVDELGLTQITAYRIVGEVVEEVLSDDTKEQIKASNLIRLDQIIEDSIDDKDRKNAIKAIDTLNKQVGAYTEKIEVSTDDEITLNFNL